VAEAVEGAALHAAAARAGQIGDPGQHLRRRAPGEGEQHDARRGLALLQQPRDAVDQRARLARAGAGDHEVRAAWRGDGLALGLVEGGDVHVRPGCVAPCSTL
jgi:hypothetical protein